MIPSEWNVIIVGSWNKAILSPLGIKKRLFNLEDEAQVEIMVPIDGIGPYKVKHGNNIVVTANDRLIIETVNPDIDNLLAAMEIGKKAVNDLPVTPFRAVGFNMKYIIEEINGDFLDLLTMRIDQKLLDSGRAVIGDIITKTIAWKSGLINIRIENKLPANRTINLNMHKDTTEITEINEWLSINKSEIENICEDICGIFMLK